MLVKVCIIYIHSSESSPVLVPPPGACLISFSLKRQGGGWGGSLRVVTLSIGSTGCNFFISLVENLVSLWSSLLGPENETDAHEVFEVANRRSPRAIIEQFEL